MAQIPHILTAVAETLENSGRTDAELPIGFTYRALAARAYDTARPTAAQLSAVRRAVARLVVDGRAERGDRWPAWDTMPWRVDLPPESHDRGDDIAFNPGGITVFRVRTAEDRAAREAWEQRKAAAAEVTA